MTSFPLPDFLAADDLGFIRVAGHRIGLNHIVGLFNDGYSAEMIAAEFETLPLSLVYKVIAFYLEHESEIDRYVEEHEAQMAQQIAEAGPAVPAIAELRRRMLRV